MARLHVEFCACSFVHVISTRLGIAHVNVCVRVFRPPKKKLDKREEIDEKSKKDRIETVQANGEVALWSGEVAA